jgi:glutaconate CoA-transferase subunit A
MLDKRMTPAEIVGRLEDGMTIGIGGWATRRKPMALVREILRSPLKDLTVVSYGGPDVGLLCAAGKIRRLIFGFVSLDVLPLDAHFRAARQAGAIECTEYDEGMVLLGLRAAGMRLPFLPTRSGLATDVLRVNPSLRTIRSPYEDGEELLAVPAIELDAALLHVTEADQLGNSVILSPDPFFDDLFARAARACYLTCERLLPTDEICSREKARYNPFERSVVTGCRPRAVRRTPDREHARLRYRCRTPQGVLGGQRRRMARLPRQVRRPGRSRGLPRRGRRRGAARCHPCAGVLKDGSESCRTTRSRSYASLPLPRRGATTARCSRAGSDCCRGLLHRSRS